MKRLAIPAVLLIGFSVIGWLVVHQIQDLSVARKATQEGVIATPPERLGVVVIPWEMGENPTAIQGPFSFAAHIVALTADQTIIIASTSDRSVLASATLSDGQGRTFESLGTTPLAQLGPLAVEAITFPPRAADAGQLCLHLVPPAEAGSNLRPVDVTIAQSSDAPDDVTHSCYLYRDGYLEQAGYRISFNAWALYRGDRVAEAASDVKGTFEEADVPGVVATSTPISLPPIAQDLSGGQPVRTEATLRIEDTTAGQVHYLYLLFLQNGKVRAALLP